MVAPVSATGCRACGTSMGQYELVCSACGTKVRYVAGIANLPPRQRELAGIAAGAIANAVAHITQAHRLGVRIALAENLLKMARSSAEEGNFSVALELASRSGEEAETCTIQWEALQGRLARAKRLIAAAKEEGIAADDSLELLEMANEASIAGDYKSALRLAIKAGKRLSEDRSGYKAWKVEIGDWL